MRTFSARSRAPAEQAWALIAEPARWKQWAPHVRGAWGLGAPEVEQGAHGAVRLGGFLPVPARILSVEPGRSWSWQVGPIAMEHRVTPRPGGCEVTVGLDGPAPLDSVVAATYGPLVAVLVRRLARVAERQAGLSSGPS